jgi:hypothetical protein
MPFPPRVGREPRKKLRAAVVLALAPSEFDGGVGFEDEFTPEYWSIRRGASDHTGAAHAIFEIPTGDPDKPDPWHFNPRHLVRPCDLTTVNMFFLCGGSEGLKMPLQAGGVLDQAAIMVDAFNVIGRTVGAWREMTKKPGE